GAAGVPVLDADLRDRLVYAALAHRDKGGYLSDFDDDAPPEDKPAARSPIFRDRTAPISLRHRTPGGAVRRGAPPRQPDPEQVIGEATEAVIAPPPQPPADPDAEPPSF